MTRVIAQQWVSVDGYASGPGGEGDLFAHVPVDVDERTQAHNLDVLGGVDHVLLGRRTHFSFAAYWPTATDPVADAVNAVQKVVASTTLRDAPWPGHVPARVVTDAVDHVRGHRAGGGGDVLVWGSLDLVDRLLAAGELDALELFVAPVVLGAGTPLLARPTRLAQRACDDWGSVTRLAYDVLGPACAAYGAICRGAVVLPTPARPW
ncbi:dihydrofolate reductase family protein [Nocardioides sp. CFH 31398]|uniref:dihydrofolate reductase family protein n=1 Tax=Nocardioides sp. CFH 31398 TaxID=2919579 RepID=UPI001F05AA45|nr:dihydrofolate reductase family protein [Nocardioides sp. CFH 31398]MCH1869045.1 dihydrofolate reductase family protein [Nocardioides sp. CFH 31398]